MKANKRVRDLNRRGKSSLRYFSKKEGGWRSTTTMPAEDNGIVRTKKCA